MHAAVALKIAAWAPGAPRNVSLMPIRIYLLPVLLLFSCCGKTLADYKADIGYTRLLGEQGANMPDGNGVLVTQAEAEAKTGDPPVIVYLPNVNDAQFTGKTIRDVTGTNPVTEFSGHATGAGRLFYGNSSSIAPAIDTVNAYNANYWLGGNYLRGLEPRSKPDFVPDRVANHSWIANATDDTEDLDILKRVDWVVELDEFIQAVGIKNNTSTNSPLLSAAFNVIAVGVTDGTHGRSTTALPAPYVDGRTKPDLVAPFGASSSSTPVIAAAAALLVETGHATASLSTDPAEISTSSRAGSTIYNAERSEVVKAVLMAGADRVTDNTTNPDPATPTNITDYRVDPVNRSANGLDIRFGAGQLNIYNSYHILSAGEQNSAEDSVSGGGSIGPYGFDYDPSFGGAGAGGGSNVTGSYYFSSGSNPVMLTAALVWNVAVADGGRNAFPGAATLYDMDLRLYDVTAGSHVLIVESASSIDNTENVWVQLDAGKDYLLEVAPKTGQAVFDWDYALAWQMTTLVDTDSDGIPDVVDLDDDNDGLPDADEATHETNPLLADTDGDGFDDGMEVAYGSSPVLGTDTPANNYSNNGDINADGRVDVVDVLLATRIVLEQYLPSELEKVRADVVPDDQINAGDLVRIQQLALGL
jgi:hypothetical protein